MATKPADLREYRFFPMRVEDLPAVLDIERRSFRAPWSARTFISELKNEFARLVVAKDSRGLVVGYMNYWLVHDEVHLLNIATHPDERRRGIGRRMVEMMIEDGRGHECVLVTLEVRRSNADAIRLYESFGFETIGVRPNYYVEDHEDALVMLARIDGPARGAPREGQ